MNFNLNKKELVLTKFLLLSGITAILCFLAFMTIGRSMAAAPSLIRMHAYTQNGTTVSNGTFKVSYTILSGQGSGSGLGIQLVEYVNASSDLDTAAVSFYAVTNVEVVTAASANTTNRIAVASGSTNTFATSNQIVILEHVASRTYERLITLSNNCVDGLGVSFTAPPTNAVVAGDMLYQITVNATLPIGLTPTATTGGSTTNLAEAQWAGKLYYGQQGYPVYVEVNGNTNRSLNNITWRYSTPPLP